MLSMKRQAQLIPILILAFAALGVAQPQLTSIQDTLYRADGTRFTGTIFINWNSFTSGSSNIATSSVTLPIVNGVLKVQLVPTTTGTAGAQYNVRYNSRGINQFTEVWAVPASSVALRVRDVRVSQGAVVGPPPVIAAVQIGDVTGLANELALRPQKGVGFGIGRAAVINTAGQLDAAVGNFSDCVRVDGTSGSCGGGSGSGVLPAFADAEIPTGLVDGSNPLFTVHFSPVPSVSLRLYRNGVLQRQGIDYSLTLNTIIFAASSVPLGGDTVLAYYRYAAPNNPLGTLTVAQVVCSGAGISIASAISTRMGTCTLPAGLLGVGDRIDVRFQYAHAGTAAGFTGQVIIGGTTLVSRSGVSSETLLTGRANFVAGTSNQAWDSQSWGSSLTFAAGAGQTSEDITQNLTVDFRGQLTSGVADTLTLVNFTVIRYPAQVNP